MAHPIATRTIAQAAAESIFSRAFLASHLLASCSPPSPASSLPR